MCNWKPPKDKAKFLPDGLECPHPAIPEREFCIFHETLERKQHNLELAKQFEVEFKKLVEQGGYDFRGFVFPDKTDLSGLDFKKSNERADFTLAIFGDGVSFKSTNFGNGAIFFVSDFGKKTNFENAEFRRYLGFLNSNFNGKVSFKNSKIDGVANFSLINFNSEANFENAVFGGEAGYASCNFNHVANFCKTKFYHRLSFSSVRFKAETDFSKSVYYGETTFEWFTFFKKAKFSDSQFTKGAFFRDVEFGDRANFHDVKFGNGSQFISSRFGEEASFYKATFARGARFEVVTFGIETLFTYAKIGKDTMFLYSKFGDNSSFFEVEFGDNVVFSNSSFEGSVNFSRLSTTPSGDDTLSPSKWKPNPAFFPHKLALSTPPKLVVQKTIFKGPAYFNHNDLSRTRFQQVDLSSLSFLHSQIHETRFIACKWGLGPEQTRRYKRGGARFNPWKRSRLLFDELIWRKLKAKSASPKKLALDPFVSAWQFWRYGFVKGSEPEPIDRVNFREVTPGDVLVTALQLKQSLEASKDPIAAGDFHFAVMEMKRHRAWEESHWTRAASLWLYKMISGYGERYGRTALWILLLIAGFSLIYADLNALYPNWEPGRPPANLDWWKRLEYGVYFAVRHVLPFKLNTGFLNTFDVHIRYWSALQTIFGTTLFTFFALALRRRFKR